MMIRVCDAFMGAGKTSAAMNYMYMHPEKRYIYITPYYDETVRIKECCKDLHFRLPSNRLEEYSFAKKNHLKELISSGVNIAITHELFKRSDREITELIKSMGYCIFIDEAIDVFKKVDVSKYDLEVVIDSGFLLSEKNEDGELEYYYDAAKSKEYKNGRLADVFTYAASQRLVNVSEGGGLEFWYWTFDPEIFKSDLDIFILTFMFEGSIMSAFLQANKVDYTYIGVRPGPLIGSTGAPVFQFQEHPQCPPQYVSELKSLIKILDNKKLNAPGDDYYALSNTWFKKKIDRNETEDLLVLKNNIYNFFRNIAKGKRESRLWSTYKIAVPKLKGEGYTKSFLSFSVKATNAYKDCTNLAYVVNVFHDPTIKLYLASRGATITDNNYALSTMVQWIWRSAIREGKSITVYIPSRRMRDLLTEWIDNSEKKYWEMKNSSANERVNLKG